MQIQIYKYIAKFIFFFYRMGGYVCALLIFLNRYKMKLQEENKPTEDL